MAGCMQIDRRVRDATGKWRIACDEFADALGWPRDPVWYWFDQLACVREMHSRLPREWAEERAFEDVLIVFDKRGMGNPN